MPNKYSIVVKKISKKYDNKEQKEKVVFNDFDAEFEKGKVHCLLGASGSGKSTLLRIVAGLEKYDTGEVVFDEEKSSLAMIFQENNLLPWLTVHKNILFSYKSWLKSQKIKCDKAVAEKVINELLEKYDLMQYKNYYPFELSGGLKQKVTLVKTLITKPDIVLLDEAFSALDFMSKDMIHEIFLSEFAKRKFTSILSTHDIHEAIELGDYIHLINKNHYYKIKNTLKVPRKGDENFDKFLDLITEKYKEGD